MENAVPRGSTPRPLHHLSDWRSGPLVCGGGERRRYRWPASRFAGERQLPLFILGGGSNLLVSDAGFPGLVLRIALRGIASTQENEPFDPFRCGRRRLGRAGRLRRRRGGLAGIECLSGIPGTVGGTPVQNVGAYGQEVSQTIVTVRAFDRKTGQFVDLPAACLRVFLPPQHLQHHPTRPLRGKPRRLLHCARMLPPILSMQILPATLPPAT